MTYIQLGAPHRLKPRNPHSIRFCLSSRATPNLSSTPAITAARRLAHGSGYFIGMDISRAGNLLELSIKAFFISSSLAPDTMANSHGWLLEADGERKAAETIFLSIS